MNFSLAGKRTLVTGASRGIGRAIALAFADSGADVAVMARNEELLNEVADEIQRRGRKAVVCVADALDEDALRAGIEHGITGLGGLDTLVNNAGGNSFSIPVATMRMSGWEKTLRLNLHSVVQATQAALPAIMESRGSIINVSSVVALRGAPTMSHYGAAKAALVSFTQSLALETAWAGVRVNALLPGWIDTDLTDFLRVSEEAEAGTLSRVPMQRWGTPDEIAGPAVFLASSAAQFMTGQSMVVDGGLSAMP
ncbi:MAG: SDR family oxidoreductase [Candidatus Nanopelagicales bacterium]|nr:SDR family oxidoreductase [Candidatus Nanopelagicales bacterium]MDP4825640.1 SDR family oxidoreductase [Candidatus Nanopelagicales bacterium]